MENALKGEYLSADAADIFFDRKARHTPTAMKKVPGMMKQLEVDRITTLEKSMEKDRHREGKRQRRIEEERQASRGRSGLRRLTF